MGRMAEIAFCVSSHRRSAFMLSESSIRKIVLNSFRNAYWLSRFASSGVEAGSSSWWVNTEFRITAWNTEFAKKQIGANRGKGGGHDCGCEMAYL